MNQADVAKLLDTVAGDLQTRGVEVVRLRDNTMLCCPVQWIAVTVRLIFDERSRRIRGWHRVTPLFGPAGSEFEIAVGDRSRAPVLNLISQLSWRAGVDTTIHEIVDVLAREIPDIWRSFGAPGAFAVNAREDPNDLAGQSELVRALVIAAVLADHEDEAARLLRELGLPLSLIPERAAAIQEAREVRAVRMAEMDIEGLCANGAEWSDAAPPAEPR
jgi:hypothetical protein